MWHVACWGDSAAAPLDGGCAAAPLGWRQLQVPRGGRQLQGAHADPDAVRIGPAPACQSTKALLPGAQDKLLQHYERYADGTANSTSAAKFK